MSTELTGPVSSACTVARQWVGDPARTEGMQNSVRRAVERIFTVPRSKSTVTDGRLLPGTAITIESGPDRDLHATDGNRQMDAERSAGMLVEPHMEPQNQNRPQKRPILPPKSLKLWWAL